MKLPKFARKLLDGEKPCGIYAILNIKSGKFYIGSSCNVRSRIGRHLCGTGSERVKRAIKVHGAEFFIGLLIEICDRKTLSEREGFWISKLKPHYNNTILTESGGRIVSDSTKEKIRAKAVGRIPSQETIEKNKKISFWKITLL